MNKAAQPEFVFDSRRCPGSVVVKQRHADGQYHGIGLIVKVTKDGTEKLKKGHRFFIDTVNPPDKKGPLIVEPEYATVKEKVIERFKH